MPLFLSSRNTAAKERMDDPDCSREELENTYRQFSTINSLISQWKKIYDHYLRPLLQNNSQGSLLDIGFGGGDIPVKLAQWANDDHFNLKVTAIDSDKRAIQFVQKLQTPQNIEFVNCSSSELCNTGRTFDFVISNHLLHHLGKQEFTDTLSDARNLSNQKVIFNDLRRSDLAYLFFNVLSRPVFRSSFITQDGLTSIKRSYTKAELIQRVPPGWHVQKLFPFRLLLTYDHE